MSFLRTMAIGAMLSVACVASPAMAQEKSLKEAIIGPWLITNWGGQVKGQITFGRTGRFTQIIIGQPIAAMKSDDPRKPDAPVVAYFGSYTVDEAGKKITGKIEAASYSPRANMETIWTVQGSGDKLTFILSPRKDQHGTFTPKIEVRRP